MDIRWRETGPNNRNLYLAEVWGDQIPEWEFDEPYPEEVYVKVNNWCIEVLGYHARTAYHVFEFKTKRDLDWFLMRWTGE